MIEHRVIESVDGVTVKVNELLGEEERKREGDHPSGHPLTDWMPPKMRLSEEGIGELEIVSERY